jgi:hypothetical protein
LKGEEASEAVETIFGSSLDVAGLQSAMAKLEEKGRYIHQRRRLSLTGTYKGSSSYRYGEGVQSPVSIDSTNQWKLSFSYGANLVPPSYDGTKPMLRYDLSLEYEDNLDDEEMTMRPSHRLIGRLTGSYSIPKVGEFMAEIVYSDDPEFLVQEELDNELSARLGLKVKFPSGG